MLLLPKGTIHVISDIHGEDKKLRHVLSSRWNTVSVADGESALNATRTLHPDLVVTDVMMPGQDGFDFVAAVRADPALAATPVLMLSARAGAEAVSEGFAGGADDYLPKPFRSQDLVDRVASRLAAVERERNGHRLTAGLMQLDAAVQSADSIAEILDAVLASPVGCGGATAVAIGVVADGEDHVQFHFAGAVPTELRDRYHVARLGSPLVGVDVIEGGHRMVIPDTMNLPPRYQHAVQDTAGYVRACVAHPLRASSGHVVGVLTLLWAQPRQFPDAELDMFNRTADITQAALNRIRLMAREHRIAVDFQEHLLDLDRGSTSAVVSAVYQPAGEAMRVGGDWYSATNLDHPGRVGISVGDVVGHGLPAAIVMSRLRAAVTVSALTAPDPAVVLGALDRYAVTVAGARCATVAYAVVDTTAEGARVSYLCAGHPYPLLVSPEQGPVFLREGRRPPVAVNADYEFGPTGTADLPPGSLILLYTDGLIERAGETLEDGFGRLQAAAAECADLPVESVCVELLDRLTPPGGYRDDVAVLALRPSHAARTQLRRGSARYAGTRPDGARPVAGLADRRRRRSGSCSGDSVGGRGSRHQCDRTRQSLRTAHDGFDRGVCSGRRNFGHRQRFRSLGGRFIGQPAQSAAGPRTHLDERTRRPDRHHPHARRHQGDAAVRPRGRQLGPASRPLPALRRVPRGAGCDGCWPTGARWR